MESPAICGAPNISTNVKYVSKLALVIMKLSTLTSILLIRVY
ncbi:unnamed protein product, partial [marine sediment metagenome]